MFGEYHQSCQHTRDEDPTCFESDSNVGGCLRTFTRRPGKTHNGRRGHGWSFIAFFFLAYHSLPT
jgi:hypothetical protein